MLAQLNDCIGGLLHLGPNVITFRALLHLGPNVNTFRTLLHLGQLLHLGLQQIRYSTRRETPCVSTRALVLFSTYPTRAHRINVTYTTSN